MPSTARPPDSVWTDAIDDAVAAGWRVYGLVTPVASPSREVAVAASASATYGSPLRFCESTTARPSNPSRLQALGEAPDRVRPGDADRPELRHYPTATARASRSMP